jgi:hypothetical protein
MPEMAEETEAVMAEEMEAITAEEMEATMVVVMEAAILAVIWAAAIWEVVISRCVSASLGGVLIMGSMHIRVVS